MNALLLSGGRVMDPANRLDTLADVLIDQGKIAAVGPTAAAQAPPGTLVLDVTGLVVCPGLIDLHVHLREHWPDGQRKHHRHGNRRRPRAAGSPPWYACRIRPPAIDNPGTVALIHDAASAHGCSVNVFVSGAITKSIAGEESWRAIGSLRNAGIVAITDDGLLRAEQRVDAPRAGNTPACSTCPVMDHCQDYSLVTDGVMHEGYWSTALGLRAAGLRRARR